MLQSRHATDVHFMFIIDGKAGFVQQLECTMWDFPKIRGYLILGSF